MQDNKQKYLKIQESKIPEKLIPKRVTIETVFSCNAHCVMCAIDSPTDRRKGVMKQPLFDKIISDLIPYKDSIEMIDLFGLGEPMLDNNIFSRIKQVKESGFKNIALSTNAQILNDVRQNKLLDSGIETVIFSIDGINKETHEAIRRGLDYDVVLKNCLEIINKRDRGDFKTRFIVRFIQQESNFEEWEKYKQFWKEKLTFSKGDMISKYNVHTFGGTLEKENLIDSRDPIVEAEPCYLLFDILYILADGSIPLCNEDWLHAKYNFGNVKDSNAIDLFNTDKFNKIRDVHLKGDKCSMDLCGKCTLLYSVKTKEVVKS